MIRKANLSDISKIESIGLLISKDFSTKNNLTERINLDYVQILVYEENDILKGFIELENHFETTDIINIAVLEEYQNQGIATKLIEYVIANLKQQNIMLEVNAENEKAINFYKRNMFIEINRRKKYYNAQDDAIIMERKLV